MTTPRLAFSLLACTLVPLASAAEERDLKALFTRIVTITPSPIGVGPELARR